MELRLRLLGINRSVDLSRFTPYRNALVVLASALLAIPLTVWLLRPAAMPDLAHGNVEGARALLAGWAKGDMIVLVRHVERCDHSSAPCLSGDDGITDRSRSVAVAVGAQFEQLGLRKADIYNSPMVRTAQTSGYMFNRVDAGDDWLINCKGTMLRGAGAQGRRAQPDPGYPQRMHGATAKGSRFASLDPWLRRLAFRHRPSAANATHTRFHRGLGLALGDHPMNPLC